MRTVLALVLLVTPAAAQIPELHWARSPGSGQWYGFTPTPTTWFDGEALGVAHGGHLATIRDAAENAWLNGIRNEIDATTVWIGLNDAAVEGTFVWTSGLPVTYTAWQSGQPGAFSPAHDAAVSSGQWFDAPPTYGGNRPVIEIGSLPPEGWKLPVGYDLPFLNPAWPELGDVDGDGRIDVVVPSREPFGTTSFAVLRGIPGGFAPAQSFGNVTNIGRVAVADFDADGHDDVAFAARNTNTLQVHFAGAAVDFAQVWSIAFTTSTFEDDVGAGDVDGDGRADLIVGSTSGTANLLHVFRADAAGGFQAPLQIVLPDSPREITVGDLDGDADLDWVVTLVFSQMTVCLNGGAGAPSSTTTMPAHFAGQSAEIADFDGDSRADLAMTSSASGSVRLLWGDGAGGFDANGPVVMQTYGSSGLAVADFDGDGRPDLCGGSTGRDEVLVLRGRGAGMFGLTTSLFGGSVPRGARTADLDGDGRPEIVWVANAAPGHPFARVITVRRFATDCDADGVDDTTEIADDPALDADLDGALDACEVAGTTFCVGDGTATACPCGNQSAIGAGEGCLHSLGTGGRLVALGTPSLAADDVRLLGSRMPNSSALYFQGMIEFAGGAGVVFGDGLRCAGGAVLRIVTRTNAGGASRYPETGEPPLATRGGVVAPGARTYQVWFRNAAAFCTASTFNLTGGVRIDWAP